MLTKATALCKLLWLDGSGSNASNTFYTLSANAITSVEAALQTYRFVARAISDCAIIGQEVEYAEIVPSTQVYIPNSTVSAENSLLLVYGTANVERFITIRIPAPKAALFTGDTIPTIDFNSSYISTLSQYILGYYSTPQGDIADELVAAVYSREF